MGRSRGGWRARFLDTGVMHRAITLAALQRGVSSHDGDAITALAAAAEIRMERCDEGDWLLLDDEDITDKLRADAGDANVSSVRGMRRRAD